MFLCYDLIIRHYVVVLLISVAGIVGLTRVPPHQQRCAQLCLRGESGSCPGTARTQHTNFDYVVDIAVRVS